MTTPEIQTQKAPQLQRPDLGIETVEPGPIFVAEVDRFPWISENKEVPTSRITLVDGTQINYGSLIGANKSLAKIADSVPENMSISAEQGLFKAMGSVLNGDQHPNIDHVADPLTAEPMFKVSKSGRDAPRLFFIISRGERKDDVPTVLRIGIAPHKKQGELAAIVTGREKKNYGQGRSR